MRIGIYMETRPESTCIYDIQEGARFHPVGAFITLAIGLVLSVYFLKGITPAIQSDIRNFPAAFQESPTIAIIATVFKLFAYTFFAFMGALLTYVPTRNVFVKRTVSGQLLNLSPGLNHKGKPVLTIQFDDRELLVPDSDELQGSISSGAQAGDDLQLTIGAFGRVLRVDKIPHGAT